MLRVSGGAEIPNYAGQEIVAESNVGANMSIVASNGAVSGTYLEEILCDIDGKKFVAWSNGGGEVNIPTDSNLKVSIGIGGVSEIYYTKTKPTNDSIEIFYND